jgi:transcriptional regulator with GAF, ATPase, and Fis domain
MTDFIFNFLAGITLTLGLSYIGFFLVKKGSHAELLFGLFACSTGIYYILVSIDSVANGVTLFFATAMFVLFPWYLAYEANYIKKPVLWLITALGTMYYLSILFLDFIDIPNFPYFFSYSVYLLTGIYCIGCVRSLIEQSKTPLWPYILVTVYYILLTTEEVVANSFEGVLPWRKLISFNYLDLFPVIIITFKFTLLIYAQWMKTTLQKEVGFYKNNINTILNQTTKYVISLDLDGSILFVNPYFEKLFATGTPLLGKDFYQLISKETTSVCKDKVFKGEDSSGDIVCKLNTTNGIRTIAWSYIRLNGNPSLQSKQYVTLFGTDISAQIEIEEQLRKAYGQLKVLKDKLQSENIQLRNDTLANSTYGDLIGQSPNFNYVMNRVEDVADLDVPVLLEGDTGVGKELIANAIHVKSKRRDQPFIKVNCAAIPFDLIESELFGFEKGAFTGADRMKKGMFELAHNGTIFLDEIGELPLAVQPKLLRTLQEGEIQRLGAEKIIKVNVRILAATNRNLRDEMEEGRFRSDLYYRINVFPITVPPLRKRKEDIPLLVEAFCAEFCQKYAKDIKHISKSLMDDLVDYSWPGNIRQLRNVIERAVITSSESVLKLASELPSEVDLSLDTEPHKEITGIGTLEMFERNFITHALEHCNWKISGKDGAAQILDLPPSTLRSKMKKLGITVA